MQQEVKPRAITRGGHIERARLLGQSVERLEAGEPVHTYVQVNSLAEFKALFAGALTPDQRKGCSTDLAQRHATALAAKATEFPLARFVDHVYGTGDLSSADAKLSETMFPTRVLVISQTDMTVTTDIVYGPSASPVVLNVGTLTFNGGSITTQNTVLSLTADALAFGSTPGTKPYHIGLMGVDAPQAGQGSTGPNTVPAQAQSGSNASPRSPGVCSGVGSGGDGSGGAVGTTGGPGGNANNGLPSLTATLAFASFAAGGQLVLYTRSGAGGQGGTGGTGGLGQQGGNGGNGCDSGCEGTDGGSAGKGGQGGPGGPGGTGSNGVNGFNITVTVPAANVRSVVTSSEVATFGAAGLAGQGGTGGQPGTRGSGGKGSSNGSTNTQGDPGTLGTKGTAGTQQGSPGQFFISGV